MRFLRQAVAVTLVSLKSMGQRLGWCVASVLGMAFVVAVVVSILSIGEGFRATLATTGAPDAALVFRGGTDTEMNSVLSLDEAKIVADAPGVRQDASGPLASAELFVVVDVPKRSTGTEANVPLRGVPPTAFAVRESLRIVKGRRFETGRNELIAGVGAAGQFSGLEPGSRLSLGKNEWTVVGVFESNGSAEESELWCDADVLQPLYRRGATFQSVFVRLDSPAAFDRFKDALTTDPRLDVKVVRAREYYEEQSRVLRQLVSTLATLFGILMGFAALFGALNTMYTAVASRSREIATPPGRGLRRRAGRSRSRRGRSCRPGGRAPGRRRRGLFKRLPDLDDELAGFSQVAFLVTPSAGARIGFALFVGFLGGIFPALRAARGCRSRPRCGSSDMDDGFRTRSRARCSSPARPAGGYDDVVKQRMSSSEGGRGHPRHRGDELGTSAKQKDAVPALAAALGDESVEVRVTVAEALGAIGEGAAPAVPALIHSLESDEDEDVRANAAEALGLVGEPAAEPAIPALLKALKDAEPQVRAYSAWALGEIAYESKEAEDALAAAMEDDDEHVRTWAAEAFPASRAWLRKKNRVPYFFRVYVISIDLYSLPSGVLA